MHDLRHWRAWKVGEAVCEEVFVTVWRQQGGEGSFPKEGADAVWSRRPGLDFKEGTKAPRAKGNEKNARNAQRCEGSTNQKYNRVGRSANTKQERYAHNCEYDVLFDGLRPRIRSFPSGTFGSPSNHFDDFCHLPVHLRPGRPERTPPVAPTD
jgi:hypothetical protein